MKYVILLIVLLPFISCNSSKFDGISLQTQEIVDRIDSINIVKGSAVGYAAIRPKQYDNFIELRLQATTNELVSLTDHPNGVVRYYSYCALILDTTIDKQLIPMKFLTDHVKIRTLFGCVGRIEEVSNLVNKVYHSKFSWEQIANGLELGRFKVYKKSPAGDSTIIVLRIDPIMYDINIFSISEIEGEDEFTVKEWCEKYELIAGINAGMFATDYKTHVGFMKSFDYINCMSSEVFGQLIV